MNENSGYLNQERRAACQPFAFVMATNILQGLNTNMTVTIHSAGLFYITQKATHDSLQSEADAIVKQQNDAGVQRSASKI